MNTKIQHLDVRAAAELAIATHPLCKDGQSLPLAEAVAKALQPKIDALEASLADRNVAALLAALGGLAPEIVHDALTGVWSGRDRPDYDDMVEALDEMAYLYRAHGSNT